MSEEKKTKEPYEPSNLNIYKVAVDETEKKRQKRRDKMAKDIDDRLGLLTQKTGATQFPVLNPQDIEKRTIIRILENAGLIKENEFEDRYHMMIDEVVKDLESREEEIKVKVAAQKAAAANKGKGIHLPPGFGKGKKRGIIKA